MPLSLAELLSEPELGLQLIAGHAGLDRRGPIGWAHISESPDPTPWMEGGELLLTIGLGVRDSPELQRGLVARLDEAGCPAVGFGVGVCMERVPDALRAEADARALPLFTVPYEVPFIAVTKRVSRQLFDEHYATLRNAVRMHRAVLSAVLSGTGVDGVLDTVGRQLPAFACVLFDYYGTLLSRRDGAAAPAPDTIRLWQALAGPMHDQDRFTIVVGGRVVIATTVRLGEEVEAVLALVGDRPLAEHEALLLEQGLAGLSLEFARGLSAREAHRAQADELLAEVADGRMAARTVARRLRRLGLDPDLAYRVLCLHRPEPVGLRALCALAEDVVTAGGGTVVLGRHEGAVHCVVQPADGEHAERLAAAASSRGWSGVRVGRSLAQTDPGALDAALRESRVAADVPGAGSVVDVAGLGLRGLLAGIDDDRGGRAFVSHVLGPVVAHDAREGSRLVDTIAAYLRHGCRPGPAAAELCVHRHTLAYRLGRVAELTGRDLRDGAHLLELGLALELHARAGGADPAGPGG
ncbi:PucR family transcriptional regulator [soil metagenome]